MASLRTSNRNFKGRGGHQNADLYISSPEVAAVSAIHGTAPFLVDNGRAEYADPCSIIRATGSLMAHIGYADRKIILDDALNICTRTERKVVITTDKDGACAKEFTDYLLETIKGLPNIKG